MGTSDWFGATCGGYQAVMTADEILAELRKLSARWKRKGKKELKEYFGEYAGGTWLMGCAAELDAIIERASVQ
jgi:hypothetical protein